MLIVMATTREKKKHIVRYVHVIGMKPLKIRLMLGS